MSLSLFRPFDDSLMTSFFDHSFRPSKNMMALDLSENKQEYTIKANAPGATKDNVSVTFKNDILTISVETNQHNEETDDGHHWHFTERSYGKSTRKVQFPHGVVKSSDIDATVQNGVINLVLPKNITKDDTTQIEVK